MKGKDTANLRASFVLISKEQMQVLLEVAKTGRKRKLNKKLAKDILWHYVTQEFEK